MGLYKDEGDGHFSITYGGMQSPFGGLDSSAPDAYIAPNRLIAAQNFALVDNTYTACRWSSLTPNNWGAYDGQHESLIGIGEASDCFFAVSYNSNTNLYYIYIWTGAITTGGPSRFPFPTPPAVGFGTGWTSLTYYAVNGTLYLSGAGLGCIYQLSLPVANQILSAPTITTTQCGGQFLAELNGRLLALNTIYLQSNDTYLAQPYQVAWSAAEEQYGIWNVLTTGTPAVPTGAGFNNIPDVEDYIRGYFSQGSNIYVLRTEGISEITPLANGIQPFDFNHLWASPKGMGTRFSGSVSQYGAVGMFLSAIDIISMGYSGINVLSGPAKNTIYAFINSAGPTAQILGQATPFNVNNNNDLYYILTIWQVNTSNFVSYLINVQSQETMQLALSTPGSNNLNGAVVSQASLFYTPQSPATLPVIAFGNLPVASTVPSLYYLPASPTAYTDTNESTLTFPPEEIEFLQNITIDGVGLYLNGTVGETLQLSINGYTYQSVTLAVEGWSYYRSMPDPTATSIMAQTQYSPQLTLTYAGNQQMEIGKVVMYGSYTHARPL